jgi:8-oxo-dGTP pyrophosphatase MutT (NUDIX family)
MEYLQVFNKEKNALDDKVSRAKKESLPDGKYFMVILIFIQNDKGEFLLQKTSKSRQSCIATTGGHVTLGDDSFTTVIKECEEELGLEIEPKKIEFVSTIMEGCCLLDTYYAKINVDLKELKLQSSEVESVDWYSIDQINKLIEQKELREGNIEPFKKVIEYLNR